MCVLLGASSACSLAWEWSANHINQELGIAIELRAAVEKVLGTFQINK